MKKPLQPFSTIIKHAISNLIFILLEMYFRILLLGKSRFFYYLFFFYFFSKYFSIFFLIIRFFSIFPIFFSQFFRFFFLQFFLLLVSKVHKTFLLNFERKYQTLVTNSCMIESDNFRIHAKKTFLANFYLYVSKLRLGNY